MSSILTSIKEALGLEEDDTAFDSDVKLQINTAFGDLNQLGVGPEEGFIVTDKTQLWATFIGERTDLEAVKTYTQLKVKLLFDPPQTSYVIESYERQLEQLAWRITNQVESE